MQFGNMMSYFGWTATNLLSWSNWMLDLKGAIDVIYFNLLILQLRKPEPQKTK